MQRARRPPTGAESGARIARHTVRALSTDFLSGDTSGFYLPLRASFSRRLDVAWHCVAAEQRRHLEARLNHAGVPRRSRAHVPPPASASARMSPNLLPTGATAKRSAAEWALRGSWVGKKLGAPAAKCGRGCTASGGTSSYWPPGYATPPPNPPLCPVAASKQ